MPQMLSAEPFVLPVSQKQHKPASRLPSTGNAAACLKPCRQDLTEVAGSSQSTTEAAKRGRSSALRQGQLCQSILGPACIFIGLLLGPCWTLSLWVIPVSLPEGSICLSPHLPEGSMCLSPHLPEGSICLSPHLRVLCPRLEAALLQHALPHKVWRHHGHKPLRHHLLQSVVHQRHLQQSSCPFEEDKLAASHLSGCVKVDAVQGLAKLQVVPAQCVCLSGWHQVCMFARSFSNL